MNLHLSVKDETESKLVFTQTMGEENLIVQYSTILYLEFNCFEAQTKNQNVERSI